MNHKIFTNAVSEENMRKVQSETLQIISDTVATSFGPYGRNTMILEAGGAVKYTKDGHTILKSLRFQDALEEAVRYSIQDITTEIVNKVGDGTTSAAILANNIFQIMQDEKIKTKLDKYTAYDIVRAFESVTTSIKDAIRLGTQKFTSDKAYDIAMVATNGNSFISETIREVYAKFGDAVFIDVGISFNENTIIKSYDGISLDAPYGDPSLINTLTGKVSIRNPQVFVFDDPIDNMELTVFLDTIIMKVLADYQKGMNTPVVVFAPKVTKDVTSTLDKLTNFMSAIDDPTLKPQFLFVTNVTTVSQRETLSDIATLTGARPIKKYIDPEIQMADIADGIAPTPETLFDFAGGADLIESDSKITKVVNPRDMFADSSKKEFSAKFNNLISYLEGEIDRTKDEGGSVSEKGILRRRLQSLKSNLVEIMVGGISIGDRDSLRDLVEDAVLNCRSAAAHGYGLASNMEALLAISEQHSLYETRDSLKNDELSRVIIEILFDAYKRLLCTLFDVSKITNHTDILDKLINDGLYAGKVYDVRNKIFSDDIITSIESDCVILDAVVKIITLITTSSGFFTSDPIYNKYID